MPLQAYKNLAYSLVATAPAPADTGTSLVVTGSTGTRFPSVPFNATIWPADTIPTPANAEIVTVTNISTDTFTITRAQESTSARTVIVGDQIAATITALTLATLEADISVASAAATSANTHAATASAAATSADAHANAASAAATSVDARVNTVSNLVSALTSAHNTLSNLVSDSLSIGNVASNALSALSDRVVSISAQLTSLEVHAFAASAAATSADAHANAASAAATSAHNRLNLVSVLSVGGVSTEGLQSAMNALSNRISAVVAGAASATSHEVSVLVQAASAAATSADAHAAAASAAATSVLAGISAVSARSVGDVSTHGFQSIVNALSQRISLAGGGTASATSAEVSAGDAAVSAQAASAINAVSNRLSLAIGFTAQRVIVQDTQSIAVSTHTAISALSVSVTGPAVYELDGVIFCSTSSSAAGVKFMLSYPGLQDPPGAMLTRHINNPGSAWQGGNTLLGANSQNILSGTSTLGGSVYPLFFEGVMRVSTTGAVQINMAPMASASASPLHILAGSYFRALRIT